MQKRLLPLLGLACACVALSSCSVTYGNKSLAESRHYESLKVGVSTKKDVYDALGQPANVMDMANHGTVWTYRYRKASNNALSYVPFGVGLIAGGKNGDVQTALALFDGKGLLQNRQLATQKLYTSNLASLKRSVDGLRDEDYDSPAQHRVKAEMKKLGKPFDKNLAKEHWLLAEALD